MDNTREKLADLVHRTVDEVNEDLELEGSMKISSDTKAVLYGSGAAIDSMTLVSLVVAVEDNLRRELGSPVTLADEKAMSMKRSPFTTLDSLIDYLIVVVEEAQTA
jgi:acyl carrier protein